MAGTGNNIHLLLTGQVNKLHGVTGYTDGEVCILFLLRMLHGVDQLLFTEHIHVQVMCALIEVAIHHLYQVVDALLLVMADGVRVDGLGVGDTVQCPLIRQLSNGVQRGQQAVLLCAVSRVCRQA